MRPAVLEWADRPVGAERSTTSENVAMNDAYHKKLLARFWAKVNKDGPVHPTLGTPCWLWTASRKWCGYGEFQMSFGRGMKYAHRVSFTLSGGVIPDGLELDHLCRVRHCVNPAHLEAVTHRENVLRSPISKPSISMARAHCPSGHPYSGDNLYVTPSGSRACRKCNLSKDKARRARLRALKGAGSGAAK